MPDWMEQKLELILLAEISTTSDMQMINTLTADSEGEQKSLLSVAEEIEKVCLKLNCFHFSPIYLP